MHCGMGRLEPSDPRAGVPAFRSVTARTSHVAVLLLSLPVRARPAADGSGAGLEEEGGAGQAVAPAFSRSPAGAGPAASAAVSACSAWMAWNEVRLAAS